MEDLGRIHQLIIPLGEHNLTFNLDIIVMTWIVLIILVTFGAIVSRRMKRIPGPIQLVGELAWTVWYDLTVGALGEERAKTYTPVICGLFLFLLMSNWIGIIPHLEEPTKDINTPLSLGLMGFAIAHFTGIKEKGFRAYAKGYLEPFPIWLPLNIIDELSKIVSISFRLFGNIMGGSIIILVVSHLIYSLILPPVLIAFFGLFIGAIQAFVFTMLTLVYIQLKVS